MGGNVITEDGMIGNSVNSQTDEDDLAKTENTQERQQENKEGFLRRQETWAPKHGWRIRP